MSFSFIFNKHNHAAYPLSAYLANLLTRHSCVPSGVSSIFIDMHQIGRGTDGAVCFFFIFCYSSCRRIKLSLRCYQQLSKSRLYSKIYFVFTSTKSRNTFTPAASSIVICGYFVWANYASIIKFLRLYLGAFWEWVTTA